MPPQVAIGICPALPDTKIPHSEFLIHERGNDMINMVQNAKDQAAALAMAAYQAAVADGTLPQAEVKTAPVEIPKDTANGDFTTTFALAASKALRQCPTIQI